MVFSTDVKALYPSLEADVVANVISEMYKESDFKVWMDVDEVSLYLAIVAERQEIRESGLEAVVKRWRHEGSGRGRRPGITSAEVMGGKSQRNNSKFLPADRLPNREEERKMIALAIKKGVQTVMKSHLYVSEGRVYRQSEGGPIGLQVTGAIARAFMLWWDQRLMQVMREATRGMRWRCYMYMRYVDDCNIVCTPFPRGSEEKDGKVIVHEEGNAEERSVCSDQRTAEIVQRLANRICEGIQVEVDYPSAHENLHMPILDLEVCVKDGVVVYRHYRKKMTNPLVIHQRSAMPMRIKRVCLANEVIRIMRNTSKDAPEEVKKFFLSEFSQRLRMSGYSERFRKDIIRAGIRGYEKQVKRDEEGQCPLYRPKGYRMEERQEEKIVKRRSWYKPFDSVIFCPPTPGGELAMRMRRVTQEVAERHDIKVRVVERAGVSLRSQLAKEDSRVGCRDRESCIVHRNGGKGDCNVEGVVYRGVCITCRDEGNASEPNRNGQVVGVPRPQRRSVESTYYGETSKSCYTRGKQHIECLNNPTTASGKANAFVKHRELYHRDEEDSVSYRVDVVKRFRKPLERQVWEGVEIHASNAGIPMNSKLDHYQPAVGRMVMRNSLDDL